MKSYSKIKQVLSRGLMLSTVVFCSFQGIAQHNRAIKADPKLGSISFTDIAGFQVDEAYIQPNELIRLKIPVTSVNHGQALPAGSCKIKIGFGSRLVLDPAFDLNAAAMSSYFKWTSDVNSGQLQITGELIAPLPANVTDVPVAFKVKGTTIGKSTITANFLITNHHTNTVLSDEDGTNNTAFLAYTVSNRAAPVSSTTINSVVTEGCSLNVSFSTDREINLVRYDVEISKDGTSFEKVANITAVGNTSYNASFELPAALRLEKLSVRIKAVETTGRNIYSAAKMANGLCKTTPVKLSVFPNPAHAVSKVSIAAEQGSFDGKYTVKVMELSGKVVISKQVVANGTQTITIDLGNIAGGKYLIQVFTSEKLQLGVLKFEKM